MFAGGVKHGLVNDYICWANGLCIRFRPCLSVKKISVKIQSINGFYCNNMGVSGYNLYYFY